MSSKRQRRTDELRLISHLIKVPGAEPGTLVADPDASASQISIIAFSPESFVERQIKDPAEIREYIGKWPVVWVNVDGLGDVSAVGKIGEIFNLHKLALEDVTTPHQRAKFEVYDGFVFLIAKMLVDRERLDTEQVSTFIGDGFVVTFQEQPGGDSFEPVRHRIRNGHGRVRSAGADYLAYSLLDSVIDHYYPVLERFGTKLDDVEDRVTARIDPKTVPALHAVRRDLLTLRRAIWPLRDAINSLLRDASPIIKSETRVFVRDCYDHVVIIIDLIETYRELGSSLMDVYLSSSSNRMNEVMKVLTIISTIFMPPTFIAGIYGMNFNPEVSPFNMPELGWRFGYVYALTLMAVLFLVTLSIFLSKGWLGGLPSRTSLDETSTDN